MVTSLGNSLKVYIDSIMENPPHKSTHPSFSGLFPSNPVYDYHKDRTSYLGTDIYEAGSNDWKVMMSVEGGETEGEGSNSGPCNVELNRIPVILEEDRTQFE